MRTFEHFPKETKCPICNTNKDKETMLVPIAGTQEGCNVQAIPIHTDCLQGNMIYYKAEGLIIIACKDAITSYNL